ncbi:SDR family oxidoreductase [Luteolibacter arcticus]|uniref:SDR family oxidoreductase n=1 Tax=Luteolibacter arcticus TaxID=1581411 RepID=A0ABT3GNS2_9BACT|nr:SDR family oxidoreductase [Luteolibacter arcticus]MCW1925170.1 SDR family oxidoreductase [Luteolibacter arcticus]
MEALEGKGVLIAGGTTGVGRATALMFAAQGCRVFVCGRDPQRLAEAIETGRQQGAEIGGVAADIGKVEGVEALFKGAEEWLGEIDIAILNAGLGAHGELTTMSHEECREVVNVNLLSYIACSLESIKRMRERGGQIIMTGSMSAAVFDKNAAVYTATKAGVRGFARSLRKEANPLGIRVCLIEPGSIATDMVDETEEEQRAMQATFRMLHADDVARAILFVASQPKRSDVIELQVRPHLQVV